MDELAKRFADLADRYGPKVVDAAFSAARIEGYSTLAGGIFALIIGVTGFYFTRLVWRKAAAANSLDAELIYGGAVILGVLSALPLVIGIWQWLDPWTWTAITHPELWIAKKAFKL